MTRNRSVGHRRPKWRLQGEDDIRQREKVPKEDVTFNVDEPIFSKSCSVHSWNWSSTRNQRIKWQNELRKGSIVAASQTKQNEDRERTNAGVHGTRKWKTQLDRRDKKVELGPSPSQPERRCSSSSKSELPSAPFQDEQVTCEEEGEEITDVWKIPRNSF